MAAPQTEAFESGTNFQFTRPREPFVSERGVDDLYPMTGFTVTQHDIKNRYESIMGPLSLFAPYPHEEEPTPETIKMERPVTPIDEEVKAAPREFEILAKYIRRRVAAKSEIEHLTTEEQQSLAGILMGEVNGIWPDIRRQVDDPFLTPKENKELQRRITVHIITVCEKLFKHYLKKAQILNRRGVFSGPANMSRLKAQLALDADKYLNILTIRRYIVEDLRKNPDDESAMSEEFIYPSKKPELPQEAIPEMSFKGLIESSRPKSKTKKHRFKTAEEDLQEIHANMPSLDTSKLYSILADIPDRSDAGSVMSGDHIDLPKKRYAKGDHRSTPSKPKYTIPRSQSVPRLKVGETLLEELGIDEDETKSTITEQVADALDRRPSFHKASTIVTKKEEPRPDTREFLREDLKRLVQRTTVAEPEDPEDLPPLLQAITRSAKHDGKKAILDKQLKELEEKERLQKERDSIPLKEPVHPQPATVATKLPNKMVVRTSDIRVSERVCMTSVTLKKHAPVYNDLIDEIDAQTVKNLDKNLFLSSEIKEVYKEIMKTVPADHLVVENDALVEKSAEFVNLSSTLASSTLTKKKSERVINPEFHKIEEAPWGNQDVRDWQKTPTSPPKDTKGNAYFDPMVPCVPNLRGPGHSMREYLGASITNIDSTGAPIQRVPDEQYVASIPDMPAAVMERLSRSYASWLQWWKSTINSDDYMKFISTQESDYLGAIFHFYNSDDDEEDDLEAKAKAKAVKDKARKQREAKLKDLRVQKADYKEGFWNVNSVLMGGLGKDPELEEEEETPEKIAEEVVEKTKKPVALIAKRSISKEATQDTLEPRDKSRLSDRPASRLTAMSKETTQSRLDGKASAADIKSVSELPQLSPQDRLEKVWASLRLPDSIKLDMAIKYSSDEYINRLEDSIDAWERATELIVQRETLIAKLEKFERLASDPNRFFERGYRGSSVARLDEAKHRSNMYKKIDQLDKEVKFAVDLVKEKFQDVITFQGRPYLEKMKWDRTEMLYWLQEERRAQALEHEARIKEMPLRMAQLAPLIPQS